MLISVHIPKCAGTSFRHILRDVYRDALWLNYGTAFVREQAHAGLIPPGTRCIHGHFLANAFDDVLPRHTLITWLRHPVERLISNYYHFLRSPDMRDDCCRGLHERRLSLLQFAELDWMRNEATRYMAGRSLPDFEFVGIVEHFSTSLDILSGKLGWTTAILPRVYNINPERTGEHYEISTRDYDIIAALNSKDVDIYHDALAALHHQEDRYLAAAM